MLGFGGRNRIVDRDCRKLVTGNTWTWIFNEYIYGLLSSLSLPPVLLLSILSLSLHPSLHLEFYSCSLMLSLYHVNEPHTVVPALMLRRLESRSRSGMH